MDVDMERLKHDVAEILRNPENRRGFIEEAEAYKEEDLTDPDTILSLARAVGVDLDNYRVEPSAPKRDHEFNTKYDTDEDLDDLDNAVDDLDGDYF